MGAPNDSTSQETCFYILGIMKKIFSLCFVNFMSMSLFLSCSPTGELIDEKNHPAFERGKALLKVGKNKEALEEFLAVTRRMIECPQSHLECGRLLLSADLNKDPVAAIYHFRRYLLLEPNAREASKVEQLIVTAEREILRKLPGEPYGEYLNSLKLKEEVDRLSSENEDLRARLGLSSSSKGLSQRIPSVGQGKPTPVLASPINKPLVQPPRQTGPTQMQTYVVQSGDSLYAISRKFYGDSSRIDLIFEANRDVMPSKNSLSVGQKLRIPPVPLNR